MAQRRLRHRFLPNGRRAALTSLLLALAGLLELAAACYLAWLLSRVDGVVAHSPGTFQDILRTEMLFDLAEAATHLACGIPFIAWFYRAYGNARATGMRAAHPQNWTIWGWIIPIINWFRPFQMMREMTRHVGPNLTQNPGLVGLWWVLFVACPWLDWLGASLRISREEQFVTGTVMMLVDKLGMVLAAILAIVIVRGLTRAHVDLHTATQAEVFE